LTIKFARPTLNSSRICLANLMGLSCSSHARASFAKEATRRTPAGFLSGTHKNYSLVDCPIYSVVKNRVAQASLPAFPPRRDLDCARAHRSRPTQGSEPMTVFSASLAPNLKLDSALAAAHPNDAPLDLRNPLFMADWWS